MKPRNKHQKMIVKIDASLRKLKVAKERWAYQHCLPHFAVRSKKGLITCMDCAHQWQSPFTTQGWQDEVMWQKCPNCKQELKIETTLKRRFSLNDYFISIETHKEHQVIRTFKIFGDYLKGKSVKYSFNEVSRVYMSEGHYEIIGYSRNYYNYHSWFGEFCLKNRGTINAHTLHPKAYYPKMDVLPIIRRNGFKDDLLDLTPFTLFNMLLNYPKAETLVKAKQLSLVYYHIEYSPRIEHYWKSVKIAIRNNYIVQKASDWIDYLAMLEEDGKDLSNPKYVCPEDLHKEHQKLLQRKQRRAKEIARLEKMQKIYEDEEDYKKLREKYFDLSFGNKLITIRTIQSVQEVSDIGDALHHCIYQSDYYKKKDSLLLVAVVRNKAIETIEFSLKTFNTKQARGLQNRPSKYHKAIVELMNKNVDLIRKFSRKRKKKSKTKKAA